MDKNILDEINREDQSEEMVSLLNSTKALVNKSRAHMSRYYSQWNDNLETFKARRRFTKQDVKASSKDQPVQMIVPLTYSQVITFVSFGFMLMLQNKKFYEFKPTGSEDYAVEDDLENLLDRDVQKNIWESVLFLFLLDVARLNLGVLELYWDTETVNVPVETTIQPTDEQGQPLGEPITTIETKPVVAYEGNRVVNINPFKFFPDTRLPIIRYQEGEFCASEDDFTMVKLYELEEAGLVGGVEFIKGMTDQAWQDRGDSQKGQYDKAGQANMPDARSAWGDTTTGNTTDTKTLGMVSVVKCQRKIIPSKYEFNGKKLGKEKYPVKYIIWYANDQRIIRCEPATNLNNRFSYYLSSYTPDHLEHLSVGLADLIDKLQSTITWFINSHITAVRRVVNNKLVIDPNAVDQRTLDAESPYILLKKGMGGLGIDKAIKQLNVGDTTAGHVADASELMRIMFLISGVNENAAGQYAPGRRSAREVGATQAGMSNRLLMNFVLMWKQCFGPLGQDMLVSTRQGVTEETVIKVLGKAILRDQQNPFAERFAAIKGTIEELVGADDYFVMPSTTTSEKGALAQNLTELFTAIISNPVMAQQLRLDPTKMLTEIFRLRGVSNIDRFELMAPIGQAAPGVPMMPGQPGQPMPMPTQPPV